MYKNSNKKEIVLPRKREDGDSQVYYAQVEVRL